MTLERRALLHYAQRGWLFKVLARFQRQAVRSPNGCLEWTGRITKRGYAIFHVRDVDRGRNFPARAHRVAYEAFVGPIPDGFTVDHVCRNRRCVDATPEHLEAVTQYENSTVRGAGPAAENRRKTECPRGHAYVGANIRIGSAGRRICRACQNEWAREYQRQKRAAS